MTFMSLISFHVAEEGFSTLVWNARTRKAGVSVVATPMEGVPVRGLGLGDIDI